MEMVVWAMLFLKKTLNLLFPSRIDTIETRADSMGVDINVFKWPWARETGSELRVHFRITFFDFLTNETEGYFSRNSLIFE